MRDFKILCLHGVGTNADILEAQIAILRYKLNQLHSNIQCRFSFVDGDYPWPPSTQVATIYGTDQEYMSYYDGSPESALNTLDDLADYIIKEGPFDAILGFSMGAMMAATLLLCPRSAGSGRSLWADARSKLRSAIFFCGLQPMNTRKLLDGELGKVGNDEVGSSGHWCELRIPTLHVWSPKDTENGSESESLVLMCDKGLRTEILHGEGHAIPSRTDTADEIVVAIVSMLSKLETRG